MSARDQAGLTAGFLRFLHRAGSRVKTVYFGAMAVWTVIHGLPLVVGLAIANLIDHAGRAVDAAVWWLLGLTVGLMVLRAVVLWGGLAMTFTLIFRVSSWLKLTVLGRLTGDSVAGGPALGDGDMLNRLREDTDEIGGLLEWTTDLIYRSVLLVVGIVVLLRTDPVTTLPLVLLLGGLWASVHLKRRVARLQEETRVAQGDIAATIADLLGGVRDLRLTGTMPGRLDDLTGRFGARRRSQVRHQVAADLMGDLFRNTVMIGTAAVLLTVSARIVSGEFTIGKLVLFLTYIAWLGEQMFFFGYILARLQSGRVSYGRLGALVPGEPRPPAPVPAGQPLTELTVTGLTCAPRPGRRAPEPVTFSVRPGDLVVITGKVGTGKSTLLRCLLGMQPDVRGSVRWNGFEVVGTGALLRSPLVGYARQSPRFFAGTVRSNLLLGRTDLGPEQLVAALDAVRLSPGSTGLPDGLDTVLDSGEARQISGGQRQRLALARMLCHPAQLYVVDDGDSSLDAATARLLWQTLPREWPGAWVVVSHNPDLIAAADTVVTLERLPSTTDVARARETLEGQPS